MMIDVLSEYLANDKESSDRSLKNFPFKYNGKTFWYSRSVAVTGFIFVEQDGQLYVLANKRGKGAPDYKGYWNCPCGYLDHNETLEEAVNREILEETGYDALVVEQDFWKVDSNPKSHKQNVSHKYVKFYKDFPKKLNNINMGEKNEVMEVKWINVNELDDYKWAFEHKERIKEIMKPWVQ